MNELTTNQKTMTSREIEDKDIPSPYRSHVYVFDNGHMVKIGRSCNPVQRIRTLETQSGMSAKKKWITPCLKKACDFERFLHEQFAEARLIGEYFSVGFEEVVSFANKSIDPFLMTQEYLDLAKEKSERLSQSMTDVLRQWAYSDKNIYLSQKAIFDTKASNAVKKSLFEYISNEYEYTCRSYEDIPKVLFEDAIVFWLFKHSMLMEGVSLSSINAVCIAIEDNEKRDMARNTILKESQLTDDDDHQYQEMLDIAVEMCSK